MMFLSSKSIKMSSFFRKNLLTITCGGINDKKFDALIPKRGNRMKRKIIIIVLSVIAIGIIVATVLSLIHEGFNLPDYF